MSLPPGADLAKLRHGQAVALQYALQVLLNSARDRQVVQGALTTTQLAAKDAIETASLGCQLATRILSPFVVELALKALMARHRDGYVAHEHRLDKLYGALPQTLQDELAREFESVKQSELQFETRSLREILSVHSQDFTDWRYLDDSESLSSDPVDTLQYVGCAVPNVYNAD